MFKIPKKSAAPLSISINVFPLIFPLTAYFSFNLLSLGSSVLSISSISSIAIVLSLGLTRLSDNAK